MQSNNVYTIERIISAGSYITVGGIGFVWLLIAAILKKHVTPFLMYHILQSIFLSILYFLIVQFAGLLYIIFGRIPIIRNIPVLINAPIPAFYNFSIVQACTTTIILYLAITAFMGIYSYIPWVSDIIKTNTGSR